MQVEQVKGMREWLLSAENILDGSWAQHEEEVTNEEVGRRFDSFLRQLQQRFETEQMSKQEQECLSHFLQVLTNLRPHLIQCYDLVGLPRTNNEMEGYIRAIKARYRRMSGRKNWNAYLLRYGRSVACYEWWREEPARKERLDERLRHVDRQHWDQERKETSRSQSEQLKRYRFRHQRQPFLASLEARWAQTAGSALLP